MKMKGYILIIAAVVALLLFLSEPRQPAAQVGLVGSGGPVSIACSADGSRVYLLLGGPSVVVSEDYGVNWKAAGKIR
jgi:hypothetical protein